MFRLHSLTLRRVPVTSAGAKLAASCAQSSHAKSTATHGGSSKLLGSQMAKIQKSVDEIRQSLSLENVATSRFPAPRSVRRQLDASERKIVREELYLSIASHPGISLDAHARKLGISPLLAKKCFGSLNCMRMIKPAKDIAM